MTPEENARRVELNRRLKLTKWERIERDKLNQMFREVTELYGCNQALALCPLKTRKA
jgi:hypothetical protein